MNVGIAQELPREIVITDEKGNMQTQKVVSDWKPLFCKLCIRHGHECKGEKLQPKKSHQEQQQEGGQQGQKRIVEQWMGKTNVPKAPA